eukprot:5782632-Amphidinium_carterae.1
MTQVVMLNRPMPTQPAQTNVVAEHQVPCSRLFGAFCERDAVYIPQGAKGMYTAGHYPLKEKTLCITEHKLTSHVTKTPAM